MTTTILAEDEKFNTLLEKTRRIVHDLAGHTERDEYMEMLLRFGLIDQACVDEYKASASPRVESRRAMRTALFWMLGEVING